jgi:hypothetical protein
VEESQPTLPAYKHLSAMYALRARCRLVGLVEADQLAHHRQQQLILSTLGQVCRVPSSHKAHTRCLYKLTSTDHAHHSAGVSDASQLRWQIDSDSPCGARHDVPQPDAGACGPVPRCHQLDHSRLLVRGC